MTDDPQPDPERELAELERELLDIPPGGDPLGRRSEVLRQLRALLSTPGEDPAGPRAQRLRWERELLQHPDPTAELIRRNGGRVPIPRCYRCDAELPDGWEPWEDCPACEREQSRG